MIRIVFFLGLLVTASLGNAQDLVITNARIIDGTGTTIEQGSVVVEDGRIVSVSAGKTDAGGPQLDARGMTVMPGLIDTHVHFLTFSGATSEEELDAWIETTLPGLLDGVLAAGVTTVLNTGDHAPAILRVKKALRSGELEGPRMLVAGPVFTAPDNHPAVTVCRDNPFCRERAVVEVDDPEFARMRVRELVDAGVDVIKAVYNDNPRRPSMDDAVLAALTAEAKAQGVPMIVHDRLYSGVARAAEIGVDGFVHTPWLESVDPNEASRLLGDADIPVTTTVAVHDYSFTDEDGVRRSVYGIPIRPETEGWRDQALNNIKGLSDAGITLSFGTDTPPLRTYSEAVASELGALGEVFSNDQVLSMITANAATFMGLSDEIGSIEAGKVADILIVGGDPLTDLNALEKVMIVIQGGRVVVDNR